MDNLMSYSEDMMMFSTDNKVNSDSNKVNSTFENQQVPEMVSRSQYYANFFTDHNHINISQTTQFSDSEDEEIPFDRVVEGCDDSSDSGIESAEDSGSSTIKHQSKHSKSRRLKYSQPCASSTIIEENTARCVPTKQPTFESVQHFSPQLCSTFLDQDTDNSDKCQPISEHSISYQPISEACSVYTWSIYDESNSASSLEEWDISEINGHKLVVKPPNCHYTKGSKVNMLNQDSQSLYLDEDCFEVKHLPRTSTRLCLHSTRIDDDFHQVPKFKQPSKKYSSRHSSASTDSVVVNKRSLLKKFKKFTKSFHSQDKSAIQTLINL